MPGDDPDDEDWAIDWGPDALTAPSPPPPDAVDTAKFRSLDYMLGREDGFTRGVVALVKALDIELHKAGVPNRSQVCFRVQLAALDMG